MRTEIVVLLGWYLAFSLTPILPIPSGLGISIAHQRGPDVAAQVLEKLGGPIWHNWTMNDQCMADPNCAPMAYSLRPSYLDQYKTIALDFPGRFVLLGSEPECCGTEIEPAEAAAFVRRWEAEVGGDYACCGLMLYAPGTIWEDWLGAYLAANGPIPPYWNLHLFQGLSDPLEEFEAWAIAHDAVRPIVLSEVAAPYLPTGPECSAEYNIRYMDYVAGLLADNRIRAAFWYSAPADLWKRWACTDLMDWDATELTPLGSHLLSLQPGGANDPRATATAEPEPAQEQKPTVWLPSVVKDD